jgi:DNA-binding SARP family transcriptional activator
MNLVERLSLGDQDGVLLKLRLFGPFDARIGEGALPGLAEHRKATQLLALLALYAGKEVSNEWVTIQLWPDNARIDNLAQALVQLRRGLGAEASRLSSKGGRIKLELSGADVDVRRLREAWDRREYGLDSLYEAVSLLQGSLLQDWFDDWVLDERARWSQNCAKALDLLFEDSMTREDFRRARELVRLIRSQGDSAEALHIRVMQGLANADESASAKEFFEEYRDHLALRCGMSAPTRMQEIYVSLPRMSPGYPPELQSGLLMLESVGGAMRLDSPFYVTRPADAQFHAALMRFDNVICLRGSRQIGKTSLLARGLAKAREAGSRVVVTDLQNLSLSETGSEESLYTALAYRIASQLKIQPPRIANSPLPTAGAAFEAFLEQDVLEASPSPVVWAIDEADTIFQFPYATNVFSAIRARFNAISLTPDEPWRNLATILTYSTETQLFIRNVNVSPFNVGSRIELTDFSFEDVCDLNRRYEHPLADQVEIQRLFDLVGGHPYLVRYSLHEMKARQLGIDALENLSQESDRFFGEHLHRLATALQADGDLVAAVRALVRKEPCRDEMAMERLRMAGVVVGGKSTGFFFRCKLYETYLSRFAA